MGFKKGIEHWLVLVLNVILAGVFFTYHIGLDQYYCLSADDYSGIDYASDGVPGFSYAMRFYLNWEGPFLSYFIQGVLMWLVSIGVKPVIVLTLVKLALVLSTSVLARAVSHKFDLGIDWGKAILTGLGFNATLYLISPDASEIWHWLVGIVYLTPLIFIQLGLAALIRGKFALAIIPLAFVMQSRATYAVLIFGLFALITVILWIKRSEAKKKWLLLSGALLVFLAIYLVAPGNYTRMTEHGNSTSFLISQFRIGLHNLFLSYNVAKLDRVFLGFLTVFPLISNGLKGKIDIKRWYWLVPGGLYIAFAIAHETLFVYITGYTEWVRVLSLHSFLFLFVCFIYGYCLFNFIPDSLRKKMKVGSVLGAAGLIGFLITGFAREQAPALEFQRQYDDRMTQILNHTGSGDTLFLNAVKYDGALYFEDFSDDPDHWINKDFMKAYELEFKVAVDSERAQSQP